jgi:hypothetical protein
LKAVVEGKNNLHRVMQPFCNTASSIPELTPWSWVLLEKLVVAQSLNKFPALYAILGAGIVQSV